MTSKITHLIKYESLLQNLRMWVSFSDYFEMPTGNISYFIFLVKVRGFVKSAEKCMQGYAAGEGLMTL